LSPITKVLRYCRLSFDVSKIVVWLCVSYGAKLIKAQLRARKTS